MIRPVTIALLLLAPVEYAYSSPIVGFALPSQLQACVDSSDCSVETTPAVVIGQMAAYSFIDNRQGTAVSGYALHYSLLPPSGENNSDLGQTDYSGDLWLTVQDSYDLSLDSNPVTVYTDTVNPQPNNILIDSNGFDIDIDLTNNALLSGNGFESIALTGDTITLQGNMALQSDQGGSALLPCVADGCLASADLNLLYLNYVQSGDLASLQFNPDDNRALLYKLTNEFDELPENGGFSVSQSYYVSAVPVPAAFWLFTSGLLGLVGTTMKRSHIHTG